MIGFADAEHEVHNANAALASRWLVPLAFALLVHCVPMFCFKLSRMPEMSDGFTITVDFTDNSADQPEAAAATEPGAQRPAAAIAATEPPRAAAAEKAVREHEPDPKTAANRVMSPAAQAPPPASVADQPREKPKLKLLDLETLAPSPGVALDESKTTKAAPKDGYLSDRTSTAADRGPKNLPRGDPFMENGESKAIRYQERRGEGNVPSLRESDTSGSVKKEGNPDAGRGTMDRRPPDAQPPLKAQAVPGTTGVPPVERHDRDDRATGVPARDEPKTQENITSPAAAARTEGRGGTDSQFPNPDQDREKLVSGPQVKPEAAPGGLIERPSAKAGESTGLGGTDSQFPNSRKLVSVPQSDPAKPDSPDELKAFEALLDGKGGTDGRGGNVGGKVGVHARPGEKGHEGDGTPRPGHNEAVSDVTTINLESSAGEFDEARFAKIYDPKTAYVKPLARRIDGKWKAERVARTRWRPVHGVVTFKVVLRKDGKLLSATEADRSPKDLPDEYSASAKVAIEEAAKPLGEPFPPALAEHETLEFAFNFLY